MGNRHKHFGEDQTCSFTDMIVDRHTDRQTRSSQYFACLSGKTSYNNNNNNNSHDNVYGAVFMTKVIARVHPVHLMNVDWAPGGRQPPDQANRLGLWVDNWQLSSTSAIAIITQPVSWHSFYRPTEGRRLSRPRHCRQCSRDAENISIANYPSDLPSAGY